VRNPTRLPCDKKASANDAVARNTEHDRPSGTSWSSRGHPARALRQPRVPAGIHWHTAFRHDVHSRAS
jgi:hypothetical protein